MQLFQRSPLWWLFLLIPVLIFAGCGSFSAGDNPQSQETLPGVDVPAVTLPAPAVTRFPSLTPTASPTLTLTSTVFFTPTPTLHPMNILAMRQTPYPSSEIVIEETLETGANYSRYIASYQSEGLKV